MMFRISTIRGVLVIFISLFFVFLLLQAQIPAVGGTAESTPQAYLPVIQKPGTPAPTAIPTPSPTPTVPPATGWLAYVNWLRSLGGLPALSENTEWSNGDWLHARYMVKNDYAGHVEDGSKPYYSLEGAAAAQNSDVMVSTDTNTSDQSAIDLWMSGPFHGLGIIDPALAVTGFGSYREADGGWQMGAAIDVSRGRGNIPPTISFPVLWPVDGGIMPYTSFLGGEWPNPLTSCPGYTTPSGPPIYLQIGNGGSVPGVSAHSFEQAGTSLPHCIFDETNYTNPDSDAQDLGRGVLDMRDAIILIPQESLIPGLAYTVSITSNGTTYTWSFVVSVTPVVLKNDSEIH